MLAPGETARHRKRVSGAGKIGPRGLKESEREESAAMLFMVIERFRDGDAAPVYRRFRERGRMTPEGLRYVESWVESDFGRCFQLMECDDPRLFREWVERWEDLVEFEIVPVVTSREAAERMAPAL